MGVEGKVREEGESESERNIVRGEGRVRVEGESERRVESVRSGRE